TDPRIGVSVMCRDTSTAQGFACLRSDRVPILAVAEGYLYNRPEVVKTLELPEVGTRATDADLMADGIRALGRKVVEAWQGHYRAIGYDQLSGEVLIVTDCYGLKPLYIAETAEHWIYSHDLKLMLDVFPIPRALDRAAASQLISMELLYDERTLV